jgi:UDP-2-acetamido-3-amino-2,3-dideoxy-glucuronate N-acetyltransferase
MIHESAICESTQIGIGTTVWAFVHILSGARIGEECNICDFVFIENEVTIGDRSTIKSGVQLWDGIKIGSDVFVGPNVTFMNDKYPKSKNRKFEKLSTVIDDFASIGANATILPGIKIGKYAVIGAGSVVTKDVPPGMVVAGNPASELKSKTFKNYLHKIIHRS